MEPHQQALNKAKIQLMTRESSAFFTTVCFSLKHRWDASAVPTAGTNGFEIVFNPTYFMQLDQEERVFLLIHESMHVALLHMARLKDRNRVKWNIAADHVINLMLLEQGFKMPAGGLANPQYKGLSTEEVYKRLPDPPSSGGGFVMDLQSPPEGGEPLQEAVQDILVRAAIQSKLQHDRPGTIPGEIQIFLDNLLSPKLPWHRILQKYLQSMAKNDYSFRRPNRRFFPEHILPSLYGEKLMDIAVAVDTSGSVSDEDFKAFVTEVDSILRMMKPEIIKLVQFDTEIKSVTTIKNVKDLMHANFKGRGGTDIRPVAEWAKSNNPRLLIVFTDGEFNFYDANIKTPVIWLIHNNEEFSAPFGKVIHYSL